MENRTQRRNLIPDFIQLSQIQVYGFVEGLTMCAPQLASRYALGYSKICIIPGVGSCPPVRNK